MAHLETLKTALHDRYLIEREIGEGGMATVYLATDRRHDRKVAVKVLRADIAATLGAERFLREIKIAANLSHPHVVPLYDSGRTGGKTDGRTELLYYVMPFVEGETLRQRLDREGRLPIPQAMQFLREVADALSFAHSRGVVHRDIKPDNVMIANRHAVVTDFGVAKAVSGATTAEGITNAGVAVGTPAYMAPEQVAADPHIDHRADIYALGTLAYELLTGRPPFGGPSPQAILAAHVTATPDPVSTGCSDVPRALESVIMRCLAKDPGDRWQTADELWSALGDVESGAHASGAVARPKKLSLVVLPFTNQSTDPENEFFADGLTEELIADLASVRALTVISRTSSMKLKGTDKDLRAIGRELGVRYALDGSVRKAGQNLRITAQLVDAVSDEPVWAEKYNGTVDDVFDLQERVSREIVKALDVTLTSDEDRRLTQRPVKDVRAYQMYVQLRDAIRRHTVTDETYALLDRAIQIEGHTPALDAMRGWVIISKVRLGINRDLKALDEAEAIARDVLARAPEQIYGHSLLATVVWERGMLPEAVQHFERALAIESNDPESLFYLLVTFILGGQNDRGAEAAERFLKSDPLSAEAWHAAGIPHTFTGDFQNCIEMTETALRMDPSHFMIRWMHGYSHALNGDLDAAAKEAAWLDEHRSGNPYTRQLGALVRALEGRRDEAVTLIDDIDISQYDAHQKFHLCESYAAAGETDRALDLFERAVHEGFYPYPFLAEHCRFLDSLRGSERFEQALTVAKERMEAFGAVGP